MVREGGGCLGIFGRRWTTLDTGRSLVLKQWGLLVPLPTEEQRLEVYEAVLLPRRSGDSDSADQFDVLTDLVAFGTGLPDEEVLYLHGVVARALGVGG